MADATDAIAGVRQELERAVLMPEHLIREYVRQLALVLATWEDEHQNEPDRRVEAENEQDTLLGAAHD